MGSSIDRKKVINNLLIIRTWNEVGKAYAYDEIDKKEKTKTVVWIDDALELLKEQEPVKPTWSQGKAYCGKCGQRLPRKRADKEINYCGYCGQEVKWNG